MNNLVQTEVIVYTITYLKFMKYLSRFPFKLNYIGLFIIRGLVVLRTNR